MNRGILLIATGHPYYGRMAFNLAMTIKAIEPDCNIALIHNDSSIAHLSETQKEVFDQFIYFNKKGVGVKLYIDLLSPYLEETLFLDVDMAWMPSKKPSDLFNELKDVEFTGITEGYYDVEKDDMSNANQTYYFWAEPKEIVEKYSVYSKKIYQWRSEVMYFKRTDAVHDFFKVAREIHENPNLKSIKKFGDEIPDELAINISAAINEIEPHQYKWKPALWIRLHGSQGVALSGMYSSYYLLSCGSNYTPGEARKIYDRLVKAAAYKLGREHVFPLANKKDFIPERQKM